MSPRSPSAPADEPVAEGQAVETGHCGHHVVHIGLNLLWLVPGVVGGSESYCVRLLRALAGADLPDLRFTLFVNTRVAAAYPELLAALPSVVAPLSGQLKPLRVAAETTWLGRAANAAGVEVMHHLGGIAPLWRPVATVVTVHDLQPFAFPENFSTVKRTFTRLVVPPSVRSAARLVTLSRSTKDDVCRRLGVAPQRVEEVPPGFDQPAVAATAEERRRVRQTYGLAGRPFFLYPAITYRHKNHEVLIRAIDALRRSRPDVVLVLTGGPGDQEPAVRALVGSLGLSDNVRRLGRVSDADLDALYREARALTFPSCYEGFGMPVLEAMSRRCPVVAADGTALPEVVGDAGLLVDPHDPDAWHRAMAGVLDDGALVARLVDAGEARARTYDWGRSVDRLAEVYRSVAAGVPGRAARRGEGRG